MNRDLSGISTFIRDQLPTAAEERKKPHITFQGEDTSGGGGGGGTSHFGGGGGEGGGKRADPKLAYGTNSGKTIRPKDADDRVHSLERENLKLKTKENLLELEIKK